MPCLDGLNYRWRILLWLQIPESSSGARGFCSDELREADRLE